MFLTMRSQGIIYFKVSSKLMGYLISKSGYHKAKTIEIIFSLFHFSLARYNFARSAAFYARSE